MAYSPLTPASRRAGAMPDNNAVGHEYRKRYHPAVETHFVQPWCGRREQRHQRRHRDGRQHEAGRTA